MPSDVQSRRVDARRQLRDLVSAAVALQPGAESVLRDCLEPRVAKDAGLAGRAGAITSGYGYILGEVGRLPSSAIAEEVAGLLRYHHLLITSTVRHFYRMSFRDESQVDRRFTSRLGPPGDRLRQIEAGLARVMKDEASASAHSTDHSLRGPLTRILASASTLTQSDVAWDGETWQRLVGAITTESVRLGQVLDNVLVLALAEAGALEVSPDYCDPAAILDAAVRRVDPSLRLAARLTLATYADQTFWSDHRLLIQALTEVLDNAARHAGSRARIDVRTRKANSKLEVTIADDGVGLPSAVRDRTTVGGIGMRTAMEILRAVGATVDIPPSTQGTRWQILLPLEPVE